MITGLRGNQPRTAIETIVFRIIKPDMTISFTLMRWPQNRAYSSFDFATVQKGKLRFIVSYSQVVLTL